MRAVNTRYDDFHEAAYAASISRPAAGHALLPAIFLGISCVRMLPHRHVQIVTKNPSTPPLPHDWMVEHVDFVTRLARSLLRDHQQAADASQDTLAAALQTPPTHGANARGWLGRVLRRTASRGRRTDRRRRDREHEAASAVDAGPASTADTVANVETHRDLADAVLQLTEPYRTTITLRYFEDLSLAEIAERMQVPKNTARSRLVRALAQLRERLNQRYGDRAAWVAAMLPLARRQLGSTTGRLVLTTASGILVKKIVIAALAVALCLLAVWQFPFRDFGRPVAVDSDGRFELTDVPRGGAAVLVAQDQTGRRAVLPLEVITGDGPVTLTMASGSRYVRLLPDSMQPLLPVVCIDDAGERIPFSVWSDGANRSTLAVTPGNPTLVELPIDAAALVIAPDAPFMRCVPLEADTTHVHVRGAL